MEACCCECLCVCLCLYGSVFSVVNGCSILITAGTSESHVPCPLQITRVNHLTLCMPKGLLSYLVPLPQLEPRSPTALLRPRPSVSPPGQARRSRLCRGATPEGNVRDFIMRQIKARGGCFKCVIFSVRLLGCLLARCGFIPEW